MKKFLLVGSALSALWTGPAIAADISVPQYKAPPVVIYNWTGCFVGGSAAGVLATQEWYDRRPGSVTYGQSFGEHDLNGFLAILQAGCDYQFGAFVIGAQVDWGWGDEIKGSTDNRIIPGFKHHARATSLGSATVRAGYAWDRLLGYVRGGAAWETDEYWYVQQPSGFRYGSAEATRSGWTVGAGMEAALFQNLSGFVEVDYYHFGTNSTDILLVTGGVLPVDIRDWKAVVKGGLNFRFGGPVTARY